MNDMRVPKINPLIKATLSGDNDDLEIKLRQMRRALERCQTLRDYRKKEFNTTKAEQKKLDGEAKRRRHEKRKEKAKSQVKSQSLSVRILVAKQKRMSLTNQGRSRRRDS